MHFKIPPAGAGTSLCQSRAVAEWSSSSSSSCSSRSPSGGMEADCGQLLRSSKHRKLLNKNNKIILALPEKDLLRDGQGGPYITFKGYVFTTRQIGGQRSIQRRSIYRV
ncbi:hypothetical protein UY3_01943 [Chelonia mydas]|uniref:Uncharacterized protein n=1 Tax=Chelonia mydas TaxID=8469 RepID=M7CIM8_CHEMY|nr:hypothetical protein UY3_01943 [Chelonia mydas]